MKRMNILYGMVLAAFLSGLFVLPVQAAPVGVGISDGPAVISVLDGSAALVDARQKTLRIAQPGIELIG